MGRRRNSEYRGAHGAPGPDFGATMDNVEWAMPDFYTHPEWYYHGGPNDRARDRKGAIIVIGTRGRPTKEVRIYRAVPNGVTAINPGDWVTQTKEYAQLHLDSVLLGDGHILTATALARDLYNAGDSLHEWGWHPHPESSTRKTNPAHRPDPLFTPDPSRPSIQFTREIILNPRLWTKYRKIYEVRPGERMHMSQVIGALRFSIPGEIQNAYNAYTLLQGLGFAACGRMSMEEVDVLGRVDGKTMRVIVNRALKLLDDTNNWTTSNAKDAWRHATREAYVGHKMPWGTTNDQWWEVMQKRTKNPATYSRDFNRAAREHSFEHDANLRRGTPLGREIAVMRRRPGAAKLTRADNKSASEWREFAGYKPNVVQTVGATALRGSYPGVRVDRLLGQTLHSKKKIVIDARRNRLYLVWASGGRRFALAGPRSTMAELARDFARIGEPVLLQVVDYLAPRYPVPAGERRTKENRELSIAFTHKVENPTIIEWNGQRDGSRALFLVKVKGRSRRWVNRSGLIF